MAIKRRPSPPERGSRVVLDTSAYSHLRAGHNDVIDLITEADIVLLPTIVLGELEAAFLCGMRLAENRTILREFLNEPFLTVLPVTGDVALRYGEIFAALRKAGTPLPGNDIWIAATTLDAGAYLLTFDRDFERIPGLRCTVLSPLRKRDPL